MRRTQPEPDEPVAAAGGLFAELRGEMEVDQAEVAAVLAVPSIPVHRRHNSKIDRPRIARWAEGILAGGRVGTI